MPNYDRNIAKRLKYSYFHTLCVLPCTAEASSDQIVSTIPCTTETFSEQIERIKSLATAFEVFQPELELDFQIDDRLINLRLRFDSLDDFTQDAIIQQIQSENAALTKEELVALLEPYKEAILRLSRSYHLLDLYFRQATYPDLSILDYDPSELTDKQWSIIESHLQSRYENDKCSPCACLVIPGVLPKIDWLEKGAKLAYRYKTLQFGDLPDYQDITEAEDFMLSLPSGRVDDYWSVVSLFCNWIRYQGSEGIFLPPSLVVAARLTDNRVAQVAAGKKYGALNYADQVRFQVLQIDASKADELKMIPIIADFNKVLAWGITTLCQGNDHSFLNNYGTVRVLNWIDINVHRILNWHLSKLKGLFVFDAKKSPQKYLEVRHFIKHDLQEFLHHAFEEKNIWKFHFQLEEVWPNTKENRWEGNIELVVEVPFEVRPLKSLYSFHMEKGEISVEFHWKMI